MEKRRMTNLPRMRAALALGMTLALLLAGCSTADKPKPAPAQPVIQGPGKAALAVTANDSGASIVMERSQELIVRLPLRGSSGADWSLVDLKPGVLRVVAGPTFERALLSVADDPSDGSSIWRLRAETPGQVALNFELRRPHALGTERTLSYPVTVK
jgi:predicted secreted protein